MQFPLQLLACFAYVCLQFIEANIRTVVIVLYNNYKKK